jgi:hypothetical protein
MQREVYLARSTLNAPNIVKCDTLVFHSAENEHATMQARPQGFDQNVFTWGGHSGYITDIILAVQRKSRVEDTCRFQLTLIKRINNGNAPLTLNNT